MGVQIPFVKDIEFEYGVADQLSPLVRRVVCNNPGPFTFTGTNTYIIGTGNVAVIDPGPSNQDHIDALMEALKGETVTHIFISHTHMDHSPGAEPLKAKTGAKICGYGPHGGGTKHTDVAQEIGGDRIFSPDIEVRNGDVFRGDNWTIECVHTPGHTSNHMCYALREEKMLFVGDHVLGWSTSIVGPPDGDMHDYMDSLDQLLKRDDVVYWPGHGPAIENPKKFVGSYIAHREERERQIEDCLKQDIHFIKEMVPAMYSDIDSRLLPAAAVSIYSQMLRMVKLGRVKCDDNDPLLDSKYSQIG